MKKRGVASLTLVWLLVAIVGGLLLGFFLQITMDLSETSNKITYGVASLKIRDLFLGASSSVKVSSETSLPLEKNMRINFTNGNKLSIYKDKKVLGSSNLLGQFVFSPGLKNKEVVLWSEAWEVPFRVTNFVFVANKDYGFNIVGNGLANGVGRELVNNRFSPGTDKKIILTNSNSFICSSFSGDVKIIYQEDGEFVYGKVCFKDGEAPFFGKALMYGAIFSDYNNYKKLYEDAILRLKNMLSLYSKKVEGTCPRADGLKGNLDYYKDELNKINPNFDLIKNYFNRIEEENRNLLDLGCDYVY